MNSIFIPDFPLTLPLSPDSGGEGGVRGDSHGAFYATLRVTHAFTPFGGRFAVSSYYLLLAPYGLFHFGVPIRFHFLYNPAES